MTNQEHYTTAPEDKIPFFSKVIYGFGAMVNNLLAAAIGGMVIVLNLGLGMNPALVGLVSALPRLTDAITDPLMGYISDKTKSKWGRRRPYIFVGAIAAGVLYALLWQLPTEQSESYYFWYFLIGSLIFYLAYTMFATPWVALGYELTPDYHERTRLMGVQNFMGYIVYMIAPWFLWFMQNDNLFDSMAQGAGWLAIIIGAFTICVGILPALFLKEPRQNIPTEKTENDTQDFAPGIKGFFSGFAETVKCKPFLYLCCATFLVFNGFMIVSAFQFYAIIYYVFGGDTSQGSEYAGYAGTLMAFSTLFVIVLVSKLATIYGKRKAFFFTTGMSMVGYGLKWFCYNPDIPWLLFIPMPFIAFGLGGLFTLMGSMIADVCDYDELNTHQRREGMFGSIYWWVVKLGQAAALAAGGFLLNATGFDVALEGNQTELTLSLIRLFDGVIPFVFSGIAILLVMAYPLTEEKSHQIRMELEGRRGKG